MSPVWPLQELLFWYYIVKTSQCNFEHQDFICGYTIFETCNINFVIGCNASCKKTRQIPVQAETKVLFHQNNDIFSTRTKTHIFLLWKMHLTMWSMCKPSCSGPMLDIILMITSSNGNIFRVTDPLWGVSTGHRWIPPTKASDTDF